MLYTCTCKQCLCVFESNKKERIFCSRLCTNKFNNSHRKLKGIHIPCDTCGKICYIKPSLVTHYTVEKHIKYCSQKCASIGFGKRHSGENNPAFGKVYRTKETHPEWAESIKNTMIENEVNVGDKNGMKNPEVASRMSKTRREKVTSDPEYRKARAKFQREAWASGKYDGVKTGLCKWYDHVKPDGTLIKLQGTWEVAYARYLDENKINYVAHKGYWNYIGEDGKEHSYHPDFYLIDEDLTIDVKGAFWDSQQENKINYIVSSNPDKKLKILRREDLDELGINLQKIQIELLNK